MVETIEKEKLEKLNHPGNNFFPVQLPAALVECRHVEAQKLRKIGELQMSFKSS